MYHHLSSVSLRPALSRLRCCPRIPLRFPRRTRQPYYLCGLTFCTSSSSTASQWRYHHVPAASSPPPSSLRSPGPLVCPECRKCFLSEVTLQRHLSTRHARQHAAAEKEVEEAFRQSNEALEAYLQRLKDALGEVREMLEEQCGEEEDTSSRHAPAVGHREIDGCCAAVTQAGGPQTVSKEAVLEYLSRSTASPAAPSSPFPKSIGTCLSHWMAVGVVRGSVKWGHYSGQLRQYAESLRANPNDDSALPQLVAEFVVETHGYVERMPGQMMLYRNQVPVRVLFRMVSWPKENGTAQDCVEDDPWSSSLRSVVRSLKEGDLVQVHGQYGLHASFDVVTRRLVENVVVEADVVSLLSKK